MSLNVQINRRNKKVSRDELLTLSKAELIEKIIRLDAHNNQLKNILSKKVHSTNIKEKEAILKKNTSKKLDFSKVYKRHVLLKFLYFGWDYDGFACQEDSNNTIEDYVFNALMRTCLIENRETANYNRCGRTDKGVSAYCQVISIDLRSKFPIDQQFSKASYTNEIDYCSILNRVLPKNIQCIGWLPLKEQQFSARFDCEKRTYRYYFPKGNLNITAMKNGCELLQNCNGDFRNFCKMDVHNGVTNYVRHIYTADIHEVLALKEIDDNAYKMYYLEITANAFLWHQIRYIMTILLLIGQEKEQPQIIRELLDVEKNPCKPQYKPVVSLPLNLYNCEFRNTTSIDESMQSDIHNENDFWLYNEQNLVNLIIKIQNEWSNYNIKSTMLRDVLCSLERLLTEQFKSYNITKQSSFLSDCVNHKNYKQLMSRNRCESLENRITHYLKRRRIVIEDQKDM